MFPTNLVDLPNPDPKAQTNSPVTPLSGCIANLNAVVEALQAKVGIDGSAVSTSLDKKTADLIADQALADDAIQGLQLSFARAARLPADVPSASTCYVHKSGATYSNAQRYNEHTVFVPVQAGPVYFSALFSNVGCRTTGVLSIAALFLARPGLSVPHGSATRVGTWTNDTSTSAESGGYRYSTTAGDTISATVTGDVVGAFIFCATNGGYAVVAIDGDYTSATRLPAFTQSDYVAGICRLEDVGRRYIQCYWTSARTDGFVFADDLADTTHTVTIQVTGTKRSAASSTRVYVESIIGCRSTDTIGTANVKMLPIREINNQCEAWSAHDWVIEWAPAGSSDYQFLGNTHADGVASKEVESSWSIHCDATDQTAISAGAYQSGTRITIQQVSTIAHKADLNTAVATKSRIYTAMANRDLPLMVQTKVTWSATGMARTEYPCMLPIGTKLNQQRTMSRGDFDTITVEGTDYDLPTLYNDTAYKLRTGHRLVFSGGDLSCFCELVGRTPKVDQLLGDYESRYQDRATLDIKGYTQTIATAGPAYASGEVVTWTIGFGALLNSDW